MNARSHEKGQILPFFAVCLTILLGFAGLAVDLGYIQYQQRQQQSAADSAAIAGAETLISKDSCSDSTDATTAADSDSSTNGFTNGTGGVTVTVTLGPNLPAPFANVTCGVEAQIYSPHATWFSNAFGFGGAVTTEAIATVVNDNNGCIFVLDPSGTPTFNGNLKLDAPGCAMLINGSPTFNGGCGKTTIDYIGYAGTISGSCSVAVPMLPVSNPCPAITGCAYLANNPPSTASCAPFSGATISPGCYSSISGVSTMNPGLYVITGEANLGGATGSGVTIYATGSGYITLGGSGAALSACTTSCTNGAVANVLYYQTPSDTESDDTHGSGNALSGLIYAPSADVTISGNSGSGYTVLVVDDITINGGGNGMTFNSPPPNGSLIQNAVLAY
jgi:Flp pilus assembly protein TadG